MSSFLRGDRVRPALMLGPLIRLPQSDHLRGLADMPGLQDQVAFLRHHIFVTSSKLRFAPMGLQAPRPRTLYGVRHAGISR